MTTSMPILAAMLGMNELIIILLILLLLFGATKLPALAKGLGQSVKEFKKASTTDDAEAKSAEPVKKPTEITKS